MGHSQAEKAMNRDRILAAAAARIRAGGLDSISVAGLMQAVNLTHGGFYNHFASRAELLAEALERALADGAGKAAGDDGEGDAGADFDAFVRSYLSRSHRDHPESGCAIAALVCDVARAKGELDALMDERVQALIDRAAGALGSDENGVLAVSAMVGALALSRVSTDPARSDDILRIVRDRVRALS